jgi:hypothetical protein
VPPEEPNPPGPVIPSGPGTSSWGISSTPDSTNWEVPQGPSQYVIPQTGEGGNVWTHTSSPDAPSASQWAVWVWEIKPVPTGPATNPFGGG